MKTGIKLPAAICLLAMPAAAYAQHGFPHFAFSFGGGLAGGFLGALLACWLSSKRRDKNGDNAKK
jgi:hypothetical protein